MKQTIFSKDLANRKIHVTREFAAPVDKTWKAWTQKELLDQWWAPKPWTAETKSMDFREGGYWLYCMVGPQGERHWGRADYKTIVALKQFTATDSFCDENGNRNSDLPIMDWKVEFQTAETGTKVQVEITFSSEKDMQTIVDMGFQEGFTAGLNNLDELLAANQTA